MLLTGDIGREVEHALIPTLDLLPIVVLKSPHHGSGTSSSEEFVSAIKPRVVVISCGRANPYGHPLPHVLARYTSAGSDVFRTDRDGQIEVTTDGKAVTVETYRTSRP
jgi:competence protein ComEC